MTAWRDHHGGACPTDPGATVRLRFASGWESKVEQVAGGFEWRRRGEPFDIVAYQVVGLPPEVSG